MIMDNKDVVKESKQLKRNSCPSSSVLCKDIIRNIPYLSLKNILNCCKMKLVFKYKTRLGNASQLKRRVPKSEFWRCL